MKHIVWSGAVVSLLLLCIATPIHAQAAPFKVSKWSNIADSHWKTTITEDAAGTKVVTNVSILTFGKTITLQFRQPCQAGETILTQTVTIRSAEPLVTFTGCGDINQEKLQYIKNQLKQSNIPTDVLNMLNLLPWWIEE